MANYGYDKNVDYTAKINQAIAAQDYRSAAIYEQQRNEKIQGEGLTKYKTTSHYVDYLPKTDEINSGLDRLANAEPWKYEKEQDPVWQSMRKQYLREADRGTRDTMAAYAAQTGGMPSTAAVGAAQQAGNYYRAQLADRIPELAQNDYSRYMQGREADREDLSLLASIEAKRAGASLDAQQLAWQKEQAQIAQAMDRWTTMGVADQSVAAILGVPVGTSTQSTAYQQWQQQQAELDRQRQAELDAQDAAYRQWQQQQAELDRQRQAELDAQDMAYRQWQMQGTDREDAYNRAMEWIARGILPSDVELAAAGIDKTQAQRAVYLVNARGASGGSGGGSGGSGGGSGGSGNRGSGGSGGGSGGSGGGSNNGNKPKTDNGREPLSGSEYQQLLNRIRNAGSYSAAYAILNPVRDRITADQAKEIGIILNRYYPARESDKPLLN
jgi:O6-methylguanine-DNA--protein-cysteine methyltransferase